MALARVLSNAGCPDGSWVGVDATDGTERLYGPSLHAWAQRTVSEDMKFRKWTPSPYGDTDA